jgi:predicted enzyme related to lactoylglutathione lyase
MEVQNNIVSWFEVPVADMERAIRFYEEVFEFKMERHILGPLDMAWFPYNQQGMGAAGSLVCHKDAYKPSQEGVLIYYSSQTGDLSDELSRIEKAGGKVLMQKTMISPEHGFMALFIDSEGNRVALYSLK